MTDPRTAESAACLVGTPAWTSKAAVSGDLAQSVRAEVPVQILNPKVQFHRRVSEQIDCPILRLPAHRQQNEIHAGKETKPSLNSKPHTITIQNPSTPKP